MQEPNLSGMAPPFSLVGFSAEAASAMVSTEGLFFSRRFPASCAAIGLVLALSTEPRPGARPGDRCEFRRAGWLDRNKYRPNSAARKPRT